MHFDKLCVDEMIILFKWDNMQGLHPQFYFPFAKQLSIANYYI